MLARDIFREIKYSISRYIAIVAIVALGVAFFAGLKSTKSDMLATAGGYMSDQKMYDFKAVSSLGFTDGDIESVRDIKDVGEAQGSVEIDAYTKNDHVGRKSGKKGGMSDTEMKEEDVAHIMSLVKGINRPDLVAGRMPESDDECVADKEFFSKGDIGDWIELGERNEDRTKAIFAKKKFKIVGLATSPLYLDFERGYSQLGLGGVSYFMYVRKGAFDIPRFTTMYMRLKGAKEAYSDDYEDALKKVGRKIEKLMPEGTHLTDRRDDVGYSNFEENSDIVDGISKVFPLFFLLVAALVCMTTMTRMVDDKRTQIGSIRALGYGSGVIMSQYLFYSISAALIGSVAGFMIGIRIFPGVIWNAYGMMYNFRSEMTYLIDLPLGYWCVGVSVICIAGATIASCINDLREVPAALVRPRSPKAGKRVWLEHVKPVWKRLSFLHQVSFRNVFRYKKRFIMMIIGIGGCSALLVAGFGINTTIKNIAKYQFNEVTKYDYRIIFDKDMSEADGRQFEKDEDLKKVDLHYLEQGSATVRNGGKSHDADIYISKGKGIRKFIDLHSGNRKIGWPESGEAVICRKMHTQQGIDAGDRIKVRYCGKTMSLKVSAVCDNFLGNPIYISESTWKEASGEDAEHNVAFAFAGKGSSDKKIKRTATRISKSDAVVGTVVNLDTVKRVDKMMESLNAVVTVVILSAGLLAFIVLYNLTNINIIERIREIATIKVLGFRPRETLAYVYRENIILTAIGAVVGIPLGKLLLLFVMDRIRVDIVYFVPRLTILDYIWSILLTFAFAVVVIFAMIRKLFNVDMVESLKSAE